MYFIGVANRKKSEQQGLKVWLCSEHHRGDYGVHGKYGKQFNEMLKQIAQKKFEKTHTRDEFIQIFGKSYL